jgi:hypothetical protein
MTMTLRAVACAWCHAEMQVPDPIGGREGYFVLPRRCRHCAGNNVVELDGAKATVQQQRKVRKRSDTQRLIAIKPLVA